MKWRGFWIGCLKGCEKIEQGTNFAEMITFFAIKYLKYIWKRKLEIFQSKTPVSAKN